MHVMYRVLRDFAFVFRVNCLYCKSASSTDIHKKIRSGSSSV